MKKLLCFLSFFAVFWGYCIPAYAYSYSYKSGSHVSEPAIYNVASKADYYCYTYVNGTYYYYWSNLSDSSLNPVMIVAYERSGDSSYRHQWYYVLSDGSIIGYNDDSITMNYCARGYSSSSGWSGDALTNLDFNTESVSNIYFYPAYKSIVTTNIPTFKSYDDIVNYVETGDVTNLLNPDEAKFPATPETWNAPEPNTESIVTGSDEGSYSSFVQVYKGESPMRFVTKFFFKIPNNRDIVGGLGFSGEVRIKGQTGSGQKFTLSYNIADEVGVDYPIVSFDTLYSVSHSSVHLPGTNGEITDYKGTGTNYPGSNELDINLHYIQAREESLRFQDIIINSVDIVGLRYCYNNILYAGLYSDDVFESTDYHFNLNTNDYTDSSGSSVGSANNGNFDNSYNNYYPKIDNLDDGGLYDFVSTGFGIFGKNGFFDMLQVSFYFLPAPVLVIIGSGVALVFALILFKILRG